MTTPAAVSDLVLGRFSEAAVKETCASLRQKLGQPATLALLFVSSDYTEDVADLVELIRLHAHVPLVVGASTFGPIAAETEAENQRGFSILLLSLPGCTATPFAFDEHLVEDTTRPADWRKRTGVDIDEVKSWLVFIDPAKCPVETWMPSWNAAYPGIPTFGGLASTGLGENESLVFSNDGVVEGGIAVALNGPISVQAVVSQGCRPIGDALPVTQAEQNVLLSLGLRPAYQVLNEAFKGLTAAEKERARGHLFVGLAMNEYIEDFKRGDFLVRNIIAADQQSGAVAINARPRVGQTVQYQLRDADAAAADFSQLLATTAEGLKEKPFAALLCTCTGRGRRLFDSPNHDVRLVEKHFPGLPVAGFFGAGEIGPIGDRNYVHGYTASVAVFSAAT